MAAEFVCTECGRHLATLTSDKRPEFGLCLMCLRMPGWFRNPEIRALVCPDHDGREAWEREVP